MFVPIFGYRITREDISAGVKDALNSFVALKVVRRKRLERLTVERPDGYEAHIKKCSFNVGFDEKPTLTEKTIYQVTKVENYIVLFEDITVIDDNKFTGKKRISKSTHELHRWLEDDEHNFEEMKSMLKQEEVEPN